MSLLSSQPCDSINSFSLFTVSLIIKYFKFKGLLRSPLFCLFWNFCRYHSRKRGAPAYMMKLAMRVFRPEGGNSRAAVN